nr:MAG TPA: Portal [Caudoviricetes sp.]
MGILSGIFKSRDKPQNATSGSAYRFFVGGSSSGKNVNERSAMQMTAVYSCVRILSEAVASLPLHVYKYNGDGGKEKAVKHPLYFLLHDEPNPEMTSFVFRETLMTHLLLWGNAYAQIIRNGKGEIIALYPLMPNRMTVDRDDKGQLYYQYNTSKDDAPTMKGSMVNLKPSDVLHIPGLGFDGLVGYSPIAMAKNAIGMAIACEEYGAKFFANGATPGGILEHPGTVKDPQRVRDSWTSAFGGSSNANKVAVLEEGMKYTPISISPEQAQFLETRKFQINEIARIFRVPPHMVGDLEKSSFSNIEQQSLEFVKYTLDPWVARWEQAIVGDILRFSGGHADSEQITCITSSNCRIGGKHSLKCVGKNPRLAQAKSKNDKNISGLLNQVDAGKIGIHTFTNASAYTLSETDTRIISIEFATTEENHAQFFGQVIVDASALQTERTANAKGTVTIPNTETDAETGETTESLVSVEVELPVTWSEDGKVICYITFELNDTINTLHCPVETWMSGKHILSLYYPIESVVSNITNTFNVYLRMENGTGAVGVGDCIASISGQAMAAAAAWDGKIEIEEKIGRFVIGGGMDVKGITDTVATQIIEYVQRSYTDQVQGRTVIGAFCRPVIVE